MDNAKPIKQFNGFTIYKHSKGYYFIGQSNNEIRCYRDQDQMTMTMKAMKIRCADINSTKALTYLIK